MILYFKVSGIRGTYISVDDQTNAVILYNKFDLQSQKEYLKEQIAQIDPNLPSTNAEWISWGKANYPYINHATEISELAKVQAILDAIRDL
jgi:uncharacterized protein YydD (DUF2326 family)